MRFFCVSTIFYFVSIYVYSVESAQPAIRVRISESGLNYTDRIGEVLLNNEIRSTKLPNMSIPISSGLGHGIATARNMRIVNFRPLTYSYILHPPNAFEWDTLGGSITIIGDWIAWYKVLFTVWFKGGFTANVNDIRLSATVSATKGPDDKPAVKLLSCKAKIGSTSVRITGGFIQSIINLFRSDIASKVKSAVESEVCKQAQIVIVNILNERLISLPADIQLGKNFTLSYSLYSDPMIATKYVETLLNSKITWNNVSSTPALCPPLPSPPAILNRMMYVWGSDGILNTLLQSAHDHQATKIDVDRNTFPEAAPYLRTTCPGQICAGNISRAIHDRYPNKYTLVELQTRSAPSVIFKSGAARLSAAVRGSLYVEPKSDQNLLIIFDIDFAGKLTVNVVNDNSMDNARLIGDLEIDQFHVHVNRSNVGYISPIEIDLVVALAKPFLQKLANSYLNTGITLPTIANVKLINAEVALLERAVQVDADIVYKNFTSNL